MDGDTTFKEFVEEQQLNFSTLDFGSREYRRLVDAFNAVKRKLHAEEEARDYLQVRATLLSNRPSEPKEVQATSTQKQHRTPRGAGSRLHPAAAGMARHRAI